MVTSRQMCGRVYDESGGWAGQRYSGRMDGAEHHSHPAVVFDLIECRFGPLPSGRLHDQCGASPRKIQGLLQFGGTPSRVILPQTVGPRPLSHSEVSMRILTRLSVISIAAAAFLSRPVVSAAPKIPSYQQFLSPASPQEVVAAQKVDRVA